MNRQLKASFKRGRETRPLPSSAKNQERPRAARPAAEFDYVGNENQVPSVTTIFEEKSMRFAERVGRVMALALLTALIGCGPSEIIIEGIVTLDGDPLEGVQVLFDQPDANNANGFAGRTDQDGHFSLKSVGEEISGDVAGTYRVSLTTAVLGRDALENTPMPPERIPKAYRNGKLTFDVPEGGTTEANFDLQSK